MTVYPIRPGTEAANNPKREVGEASATDKDMFLKLMVAQLQNQDPSSPMDQKDMMAQMAQFTQVEQSTNMVKALNTMSHNAEITQGANLIGKTVDYAFPISETESVIRTSKVTHVTNSNGEVRVKLEDNMALTLNEIVRISQ